MRLVADECTIGFLRWAEKRLKLLGFEVVFPPRGIRRHDPALAEFARRVGGVVVTYDGRFPGDKVVLDGRLKYEEQYTQLVRELSRRGKGGDVPRERPPRDLEVGRWRGPDLPGSRIPSQAAGVGG